MPNPRIKIGIWIILSLSISLLSGCILFWALPAMMGGGGDDTGSSGSSTTTGSSGGLKTITGIIYETIYGSVKIAPSGGVRITYELGGVTYEASTGSDGSFTLSGLPEGTGKLKASKDGYTENELSFDAASTSTNFSRSITRRNSNHVFIGSGGGTVNTFTDSSLPKCQVSIPAGALTSDVEMELTPFITVSDLPGSFPAGTLPLAGANLKSTPSTVFAGGYKAECYIILPSYMRPDSLTGATIELMEYISGRWVSVSAGSGAYISSGQWTGYLGPNQADPAKISGCYPWCYVVKFATATANNYAYVSGKVATITGTGLSGILVVGYGAAATTDQNGNYTLGPLTVISSDTLIPITAYLNGYLPSNQFISLTTGQATTGVDFILKSMGDLAGISGKVANASTTAGIANAEVSYKRSPAIKSLSYDNRGTLTDITDDTFTVIPSAGVNPTDYQWVISRNNQTYTPTAYTTASVVISSLFAAAQSQGMTVDTIYAYKVSCSVSITGGQILTVDGGFQIAFSGITPYLKDIQLPIMVEFGAEVVGTTNANGFYRFLDVPIGEPLTLTAKATGYNTVETIVSPLVTGEAFPYNFQLSSTGTDATPPTITANSPANNAQNVAIDTNVQVTFSETMNNSTINSTTFKVSTGGVDITGQIGYNSSNYIATFTPATSLAYSATYTVTVSTGAKDLAGNGLAADYTFSFITISNYPAIPSAFIATALSSSQVRLTWQDTSTNETGFEIERAPAASGPWTTVYLSPPNAVSYIDTGLTASTLYYYRIEAYNLNGASGYSSAVSASTFATPTTPPTAPTGLAATAVSASQVNLSWTDTANNEESFDIERKTGVTGTYANIAVISVPNTVSYADTANLAPSTTYYYRVKATNSIGFNYSADASVTTPAPALTAPNPPSQLAAIGVSSTQIDLSWQDNSDNEDGFMIQRKMGSGGSYSFIATPDTNTTTYHDGGLSPNTVYYYRVQAYNPYGYSAWSVEANASTSAPATTLPNIPSNLTATAVSATQINLAWSDNSTNEDGFRIYQKITGGSTYNEVASVPANTTSYSVNQGLSSNTSYTFQVKAYNNVGNSPPSNTVACTTWPQVPSAPWLSAPYDNQTEVSLKPTFIWTAGGTSNQLQVSTTNTFSSTVVNQSNITETTYTLVSNLNTNTTYYWRVQTSNISGASPWPSANSFTTTSSPLAPDTLIANAASYSRINLSWYNNANNQDGFKVFRSTDGVNFSQVATATQNSYADQPLNANTLYYYQVKAYNSAGDSGPSNTAQATTWPPIPAAPVLASPANGAVNRALNQLVIWNAASYATTYHMQVSLSSSDWSALVNDQTNLMSTDTGANGLSAGTTYYWRVQALNNSGVGPWSDIWNFTTDTIPAKPIAMSATAVSDTQVNLAWEDKSNNETGFQILYSTDDTNYSNLYSVGPDINTYSHQGAYPNTLYYYKVYAYNTAGNSQNSNSASATTWVPAPYNTTVYSPGNGATGQTQTPDLSWYPATYAETYKLQIATDAAFSNIVRDISGIAGTSYTVGTALDPGTTYYWHVKGVNVSGESIWTDYFYFTTIAYKPDLLIKRSTEGSYIGDYIYNSDGTDQSKTDYPEFGNTFTYNFQIQNDGNGTDTFTFTGTSGNSQWAVTYYNNSFTNVTSGVVNGTDFISLASGNSVIYTVEITPLTETAVALNVYFTATSQASVTQKDTLRVTVDIPKWKQVSPGVRHNIAVKTDGTLWAWGENNSGQLGLGDYNNRWGPVQVGTDTDWDKASSGNGFSLALKTNGTIWTWGENNAGQLGLGHNSPRNTPQKVGSDSDWNKIAAGGYHTMAVKNNGTLWTWGDNGNGQLGYGNSGGYITVPTNVTAVASSWTYISAGFMHSIAFNSNNNAYSWGFNGFGALGLGDWNPRYLPTPLTLTGWTTIKTAYHHNIGIAGDGTLWTWGYNSRGQLGLNDQTNRNAPTKVSAATDWAAAATGFDHSIVRKTNGAMYASGSNDYGQLGTGYAIWTFSEITTTTGALLATGRDHSFTIQSTGAMYSWGWNEYGQLGHGDKKNRTWPTKVYLKWLVVSGGNGHTVGLKSDGTLWAWGDNWAGQLGVGEQTQDIRLPGSAQAPTGHLLTAALLIP